MRGTLAVFRELDADVLEIRVFVAGEPDIAYVADREGWTARRLIHQR
jgi:hypothetical protein